MEEHTDLTLTSTQLKRPHIQEESATWKNPKVSKRKVTLEELMSKQATVFRLLKAQLQELHV